MSEYIFPQSDTLAESYPKLQNELRRQNEEDKKLQSEITANKADIEKKLEQHKTSDDHTADKIRYDGKIAKDNVKDALDETDTRIDNIVSQGGSDNTEVVDARHSTTKNKTYNTLKGRLEDGEQDIEKLKTDTNVAESVTETSYDSVISVPDSAVNGQVSGVVRGNTYTNLLGENGSFENGVNLFTFGQPSLITSEKSVTGDKSLKVPSHETSLYTSYRPVQVPHGYYLLTCYSMCTDYQESEWSLHPWWDGGGAKVVFDTSKLNSWQKIGTKFNYNNGDLRINLYNGKNTTFWDGFLLVRISEDEYQNMTIEELLSKYQYIDDTKSTIGSARIKSVGKNLFDKNNAIVGKFIAVETDEERTDTMDISTGYIPCSPNSEYVQNVNARYTPRGVAFYDSNKNFISGSSNPTFGFVTPSNCAYFRTCFANDNNELETFQIEKGDTATEYEPYIEDRAYVTAVKDGKIVDLKSLPNGVADEIDLEQGKMIKRVSDEVVLDGDLPWGAFNASYSDIYRIQMDGWVEKNNSLASANDVGIAKSDDGDYPVRNAANENMRALALHGSGNLYVCVEREKIDTMPSGGTLTGFKEYLNKYPITLTYQLAEPEIIPVRWTGLQAYEGGTVYVDTIIPELGFYCDNGLESHYPDHPIQSIDTLYRVDKETGYRETLDVSKCEIREDRLSFTHPDLVDGDLCDWDYVPMTESTRPETSLVFPSNLKASVNSLLDAEQINKKEHNIFKARLDNHDRDIERVDADIENVQSDIDTHKQDNSNPHSVTPEQIGAETPEGAQDKVDVVNNSLLPKSIFTPTFSNSYGSVVDLLFYVPHNMNMQGITFYDGYVYIGFDVGNGQGKIIKYDLNGKPLIESPSLGIGHTAELAHRKSNGHIYVANGGGSNPTHIYEVDMGATTPYVVSDLNFEHLGNSALVAIDNENDHLIIHTATNDNAEPIFSICEFDGTILKQFTIPYQGIPQGLEHFKGLIYYYTNNKITMLSCSGDIIDVVHVRKQGESEGLSLAGDYGTPFLIVGYNNPNRVYAIRPPENEKFHNLKVVNGVNKKDQGHISLVPRMFVVPIRKNSESSWGVAEWSNAMSDSNMIDNIKVFDTEIHIVLKFKFVSVGYFGCTRSLPFHENQIDADLNLSSDSQTLVLRFFKNGEIQNPSTIPVGSNIRCLVIGGVHIEL